LLIFFMMQFYEVGTGYETWGLSDGYTEAAHMAGFSDQSHFTRSCINMIGVPPSSIIKNSKSIQVSFLS